MTAPPEAIVVVFCGVLGLLIGSFLNVVIYRVPLGLSLVRPPSRCPSCEQPIRPRHNLPVISWLALRGRCADCHCAISVRYPLVEAGTGAAFALLAVSFHGSVALPAVLYLGAAGIALALIDVDTHRLPNAIVLSSWVVVFALLVGASVVDDTWSALIRAVLGSAASAALFVTIRLAWPGGMGGGDVKLAALLGLVTGWLGWGVLAIGVFGGFLLGSIVGLTLIAAGRASRKTAIPFGPFLIAGAFVAVLVGAQLSGAYADLITRAAS